MWKRNLGASVPDENNAGLQIKIVDVSWYHTNVIDLLKTIKDFHPNTLIIDWCFTRGGFMMEQLTTSGIASRLRMETEMFLISKNKQISLSDEQKSVLQDVEDMKLKPRTGSVVFLYGPFGCGKTILGIETGRI